MRYGRRPVLYRLDHHARLRIDDRDRIAVEVGRVDQAAVGREGHVADEILSRWASGHQRRERCARPSSLPSARAEFEDRALRAAAYVDAVALRREMARPSQPSVTGTLPRTSPEAVSITLMLGGR